MREKAYRNGRAFVGRAPVPSARRFKKYARVLSLIATDLPKIHVEEDKARAKLKINYLIGMINMKLQLYDQLQYLMIYANNVHMLQELYSLGSSGLEPKEKNMLVDFRSDQKKKLAEEIHLRISNLLKNQPVEQLFKEWGNQKLTNYFYNTLNNLRLQITDLQIRQLEQPVEQQSSSSGESEAGMPKGKEEQRLAEKQISSEESADTRDKVLRMLAEYTSNYRPPTLQ